MEAWAYLADSNNDQKIFGKADPLPDYGYILGVRGGNLRPEIWDVTGTKHTFELGTVGSNQWVHHAGASQHLSYRPPALVEHAITRIGSSFHEREVV